LKGDVDTCYFVSLEIQSADPSVGENSKVGPGLMTVEDGVDIGNAGAAAIAIIWVIGNREESGVISTIFPVLASTPFNLPNALFEATSISNLLVKVVDHGNFHR
jgi:hypothetical protein